MKILRIKLVEVIRTLVMVLITVEFGVAQVTDNAATEHVFAQVADGRFSDGSHYRSTFIIATDSSSQLSCTLRLYRMSIPGFGDGSTRTVTIPAGGWYVFRGSGTQSFQSGFLTVSCTGSVTAQVQYSYHNAAGTTLSEATVFSSPAATVAQLLADQRGGSQLGIAIVNNGSTSKPFVIAAVDASDNLVGRTTVQIAAQSQTSRFLSELVSLPASFVGQVYIYSDTSSIRDVYAIGLRYTGAAFTTVPVTLRRADSSTLLSSALGGTGK